MKSPLLELKNITKTFPGTRALDGVELSVGTGEVVALLGENGAGKSTLMKILSGVWPAGSFGGTISIPEATRGRTPSEGSKVWLKPVEFNDTRDAHKAGVAMIHQELSVFPELTVAEHLELDQLPRWIDWSQLHERAQKFLDTLGFGLQSDTRVGDLSVGGRQLVEIARALYRDARVLVFDEPTSALTEQEVARLYKIVDQLRAQGRGIIYITHRLDEVFRLADRMVVLRDGKNAGEASAYRDGVRIPRKEIEPQLITWMVGRAIEDIYPPRNAKFGEELLDVRDLTITKRNGKKAVDGFSFKLRAGEVVGLGGLLGAGRSETFESIFGVLNGAGPRGETFRVSGEIRVKGKLLTPKSPREAIGARMAFVSEDRKGSGLVLNQSIFSNMMLPSIASGRAGVSRSSGLLSMISEERQMVLGQTWKKELRIKAADLAQPVAELSGGNQQKVVLAKWLLTEPEILFLDEPTRGVDVGAKVEIYQWIQKLAAQGLGIVVASSEMPELLGLCHRIVVLREGRFSAEFPAEQATQEEIMRAASL